MTAYTFQEGVPEGFASDFESGIFHDPRHLQLQSPQGWHSFVLLNQKQKTVLGLVHYHVDNIRASSPYRSPYGSVLFSKSITDIQLRDFIIDAEQLLKEKGVDEIFLKNPPVVYSAENIRLQRVLIESGYRIELEETSAVIAVNERSFESILNQTKRNLLRRGHSSGLTFRQVPTNRFAEVYVFLEQCYSDKGYQLSMTLENLQRVAETFPQNILLFEVMDQEEEVAACISIRVKPTILYTFYYNHLKAFDSISPIVFLMEGIYKFCVQQGIRLLDLGTSNKGPELNEPLINFKLSLGAEPSRKLTFVKKLS